ncbi:MAG TPA: hypothetical protein VJU81_04270 [Methylomirabilota bacterium]|nr:hypothetical protein [Methylomirabilota bacterium]
MRVPGGDLRLLLLLVLLLVVSLGGMTWVLVRAGIRMSLDTEMPY